MCAVSISLALMLAACSDDGASKDPGPGGSGGDDSANGDSATDDSGESGDTGAPAVIPPCADGGWGSIADPDDAIHVRADGSDDGDGSAGSPVASLDAALELTRADGATKRIALGPGEFASSLVVDQDAGDGASDDGLAVEGCSADETVLVGADASLPVIKVVAAQDVRLAGFATSGGRRAIWIWSGASVAIESVVVRDAARVGIVVDGATTSADLVDVEVRGPSSETSGSGASIGYGITVQAANANEESAGAFTMEGGGVWGATTVGILGHFANVTLSGVTVADTSPAPDGTLGRGVQLQELSQGSISACTIQGNSDAGIFSVGSLLLDLDQVVVDGTDGVAIPDSSDTSGDGIVVTQGTTNYDPALFQASLTSNSVTGSARAGIVLENVTAALSGNVAGDDNGVSWDGSSICAQDGAVVSGDIYAELDADAAMPLNRMDVEADDLTE